MNSFRIGISVAPPLIVKAKDNPLGYEGILAHMMEYIAKGMNFRYAYYESPENKGRDIFGNGTWTGLIGMVQRNELDMILGPLHTTSEIMKVLDYTYIAFRHNVIMAMNWPSSSESQQLFGFAYLLDTKVWICLLVSYALISIFSTLLDFINHKALTSLTNEHWHRSSANDHSLNIFKNYMDQSHNVLAPLLLQSITSIPAFHSIRILLTSWFICAIIVSNCFTSQLVSSLSIKSNPHLINTVEELGNEFQGKIYIPRIAPPRAKIENSDKPEYQKLWKKIQREKTTFMITKLMEQSKLSDVMEGKAVVIGPETEFYGEVEKRALMKGEQCQFRIADEILQQLQGSIGVKKSLSNTFKENMNLRILHYLEGGLQEPDKDRYLRNYKTCLGSHSFTETVKPIEARDVRGIFILWTTGNLIGFVILLGELVKRFLAT